MMDGDIWYHQIWGNAPVSFFFFLLLCPALLPSQGLPAGPEALLTASKIISVSAALEALSIASQALPSHPTMTVPNNYQTNMTFNFNETSRAEATSDHVKILQLPSKVVRR